MTDRERILKKYLTPPSIELILKVVKDAGVKPYQFERYFGIPKGTIKQIKCGAKVLPIKYWETFFLWEENKTVTKNRTKKVTGKVTKITPSKASERLKALLK